MNNLSRYLCLLAVVVLLSYQHCYPHPTASFKSSYHDYVLDIPITKEQKETGIPMPVTILSLESTNDERWLLDMCMVVKNTGSKAIYYFDAVITDPKDIRETADMPYFIPAARFSWGDKNLAIGRRACTIEDIMWRPGEVLRIKNSMSKSKPDSPLNDIRIAINQVSYADGTGWP